MGVCTPYRDNRNRSCDLQCTVIDWPLRSYAGELGAIRVRRHRRSSYVGLPPAVQNPLELDLGTEGTVSALKAREAEMRTAADLRPAGVVRPVMPPLVLPRRYEALEAEAKVRSLPLRPLVRPVREALTDIERDIRLVRETGMGRLYVINGVTGSGKTTFLNSLSLYIDDIQVHNVKGMSLEHRGAVENSLALLRRDLSVVSVVVLEGREAPGSLQNEELDLLLTTINSDFRSDTGRKTLFVIPTTSPALAQQISARAAEIGGMTSRERPFFVFSGPPRGQYIEIVNETLGAFNESRILVDYGVPDELTKGIAEASSSIGQFMESCHQEIMQRRASLEAAAAEVKHKRIHLWMVFSPFEDDLRRSHDVIRALTVGEQQVVQPSRILSGDSREVRDWQTRAADFAQAASYLDLRLMYLPMRTALAIITAYAPSDLLTSWKQKGLMQRETVHVRAQESLANTAIGAFLQQRGFKDDPARRGKLEERQKELFQEVMKIAQNDETILNAMVAQTVREWLRDPEKIVTTEQDLDEQRRLLGDIAVITPTDIYCLEMKWRSSQLHDSEVSRETVARVTDFVKNLPELRHLLPPH